jgi:hypothetical protein
MSVGHACSEQSLNISWLIHPNYQQITPAELKHISDIVIGAETLGQESAAVTAGYAHGFHVNGWHYVLPTSVDKHLTGRLIDDDRIMSSNYRDLDN